MQSPLDFTYCLATFLPMKMSMLLEGFGNFPIVRGESFSGDNRKNSKDFG